jgi:hypothetical protein
MNKVGGKKHFLTSKHVTQLQQSKHSYIDINTDVETHGTEQRAEK